MHDDLEQFDTEQNLTLNKLNHIEVDLHPVDTNKDFRHIFLEKQTKKTIVVQLKMCFYFLTHYKTLLVHRIDLDNVEFHRRFLTIKVFDFLHHNSVPLLVNEQEEKEKQTLSSRRVSARSRKAKRKTH